MHEALFLEFSYLFHRMFNGIKESAALWNQRKFFDALTFLKHCGPGGGMSDLVAYVDGGSSTIRGRPALE